MGAAAVAILTVAVLLLCAARAEAVPSVSYECTPAPQDCSGWYRSNVSIEWTVLPSTASKTGCQNKTLTADTAGTNEFCRAVDGQTAATVEVTLKLDKTPPAVTGGAPSRAADLDGWYRAPVGIAFSGSDQTSGINACTSTTYGGPDSATASVTGTCTDKAGNTSAGLGYGLKYDATAPVISGAAPERPANAAGWFNRAVRFDLQAADATSGIADCPSVTYGGPDSATAAFTGSCRDRAGNIANRSFPLKYDATAPGATGAQAARGPDANGWYNRSVGIAFTGTDQTSGIEGCTATSYGGPDSSAASVSGSCADRAGNVSGQVGFGLKYDATKPVVTAGRPARAADVNGWYNRAVAIEFTGADQTSGVEGCTTILYGGPDTGAASVSGSCVDRAGNLSSPLGYGLKYDATGPDVTGAQVQRPPDHGEWYTAPVRFDITGADATSGLAECPSVTYAGPDGATAAATGRCRDHAGNVTSRAFPLKYDATAPTMTSAQAARGPDVNGWYNHAVAIAFSGSDQVSGVEGCTATTYGGPDRAAGSVPGTCRDRAGNVSSPLDFALKYDATRPAVVGAQPGRGPDANGWYNHPVSLTFSGSDQTSGVDSCTSTGYGGPDRADVSLSGNCKDKAGNLSGSLDIALKYDGTKPAVTRSDAARGPDANGWYNHPVEIAFTGSDQTSGLDGCTNGRYDGPDRAPASVSGTCIDKAGNVSSAAEHSLKYDSTGPDVTGSQSERPPDHGVWFTGPVRFDFSGADGMSGLAECPPVLYSGPDSATASVIGGCRDNAGNVSSRAFALSFDSTPPPVIDLKAAPGDRSVGLSWRTSADAESVAVVRSPGVASAPATVVFRGPGSTFADTSVDNGVRYAYEVRTQDAAGNAGSATVFATPSAPPPAASAAPSQGVATAGAATPATEQRPSGRRLLAPASGAVFSPRHPPLLRWTRVGRARYYNVQLFRNGHKILSAWPSRARYQLERSWTYRGERRRLVPDVYTWLVWPGIGPRSEAEYGRRIGRGKFEIARPGETARVALDAS